MPTLFFLRFFLAVFERFFAILIAGGGAMFVFSGGGGGGGAGAGVCVSPFVVCRLLNCFVFVLFCLD